MKKISIYLSNGRVITPDTYGDLMTDPSWWTQRTDHVMVKCGASSHIINPAFITEIEVKEVTTDDGNAGD